MTKLEEELQRYASIDSDELSEVSELLLNLSRYKPYLSEEFNAALESEMKSILQNYKDFSTIGTETRTETYTVSYLEWKN